MRWVGGAAPRRGGSWRSGEDVSHLARWQGVQVCLETPGPLHACSVSPPLSPTFHSIPLFRFEKMEHVKVGEKEKVPVAPGPHVKDPRAPPEGAGASGLGDQCEDIFIPHAVGARW